MTSPCFPTLGFPFSWSNSFFHDRKLFGAFFQMLQIISCLWHRRSNDFTLYISTYSFHNLQIEFFSYKQEVCQIICYELLKAKICNNLSTVCLKTNLSSFLDAEKTPIYDFLQQLVTPFYSFPFTALFGSFIFSCS